MIKSFPQQYFVTLVFDCKMKADKVTAVLESVVKKLLNSFLTADGAATYFHAPCYFLGEKPMDFNNCKKNCREGKYYKMSPGVSYK